MLLFWAIALPIVLIGMLIAVAVTIDRARSVDPAAVEQLASLQDDLRLLYRKTNIKGVCTQSPPILSDTYDVLKLQAYAKKLAYFYHLPLHLREPIFDISFARQAEGVGGHVDWRGASRSRPVIFIEVDPRLRCDAKATMCVLAHEFSHVVLEREGCRRSELVANERLVDLYTLWSGFGPLMLRYKNGSIVLGYLEADEIACLILLREELVGSWPFDCSQNPDYSLAHARRLIRAQRRTAEADMHRGIKRCDICGQMNRVRIDVGPIRALDEAKCGLCGMPLG